jgi:two-component system NtrC family sensor kinase
VKAPDTPVNEYARLAALERYAVLDTPAEPSFDVLTSLAGEVLDVPIALVSFLDSQRQWFKARRGLDAIQISREVSFCGHLVAQQGPLIVTDAHTDERFRNNPLVTGEPRVRFYAGVPLRTPDGFVIGSLSAIDRVAREPTRKQLDVLAVLAAQAVDHLETRRQQLTLAAEREEASRQKRHLEVLFAAMSEGVVVHNAAGAIVSSNAAASRILGLTVEQMNGRTSLDPGWRSIREDGSPFPGETHPAMVTLRTGQPCSNVIMGVHKPNGTLVWISINALPMKGDSGDRGAVLCTFHDVTAMKAAQASAEHFARQEHFVTTGTLAAGVGHEINNPLTFINANLEYAIEELRSLSGESPSDRLLEITSVLAEAKDGADRIRKIVRGLRALAREASEAIPIELGSVIELSLNMADHEIRLASACECKLEPGLFVLADEARLAQVFVNILVNAAQAFPSSGLARNHITVTTSAFDETRVLVCISDNGSGIAPEVLPRIFDPFFTTKPSGTGTGLGLSISKNIVTSLGGEISVQSTLGQGTTFRLLLPRTLV